MCDVVCVVHCVRSTECPYKCARVDLRPSVLSTPPSVCFGDAAGSVTHLQSNQGISNDVACVPRAQESAHVQHAGSASPKQEERRDAKQAAPSGAAFTEDKDKTAALQTVKVRRAWGGRKQLARNSRCLRVHVLLADRRAQMVDKSYTGCACVG